MTLHGSSVGTLVTAKELHLNSMVSCWRKAAVAKETECRWETVPRHSQLLAVTVLFFLSPL